MVVDYPVEESWNDAAPRAAAIMCMGAVAAVAWYLVSRNHMLASWFSSRRACKVQSIGYVSESTAVTAYSWIATKTLMRLAWTGVPR